MGAWGIKLYQDDVALDAKEEYIELLKKGWTNEEATKELVNNYVDYIKDREDGPIFWFALADTQWDYGRLLPEVKNKALQYLESSADLDRWSNDLKSYKQRQEVLIKLKEKLNSPQPTEKKISIPKLYKCEWKIGDVYAYKLESELAKEKKLYGKYLLFIKVDESIWYPGHIIPIVRVKITSDGVLPNGEEDINNSEYVQISFTLYEDRFLPLRGDQPLDQQIKEKSKINYKVDDYGYLPEYMMSMISTSKRVIPKKLIYLGNFTNINSPYVEFIPHSKLNIYSCFWKDIEESIIDRYIGHNLRQYDIYSK